VAVRAQRPPGVGGGTLHYPPVLSPRSSTISSRYLSEDERVTITDLHRTGLSSRAIAEQVRCSPSTISRELARNSVPDGRYGSAAAHRLASGRRRRPRARRLEADPVLRAFVQQCMDVRWSPEQLSHAVTVEFPDQPGRQLVPESLYQALYAATPVLQRTFRTRRWRRRRRPHRSPDARSSYRLATPMVMIDQRPAAADDRVEVGHWEGDLIMGLGNGSAIGTLVERSTRTLILVHLPHGRTAAAGARGSRTGPAGRLWAGAPEGGVFTDRDRPQPERDRRAAWRIGAAATGSGSRLRTIPFNSSYTGVVLVYASCRVEEVGVGSSVAGPGVGGSADEGVPRRGGGCGDRGVWAH